MKDEITAAVFFLSKILQKKNLLTKDQIDKFSERLTSILVKRFNNHWHDEKPTRGQGYRCLRVNDSEPRDPVLEEAAVRSGLRYEDLCFPSELTLWVDPREVCCRLGENRHSSYSRVATFREGSSENCAEALDLDKILEEHESARRTELSKFLQATSHRSRSPGNGGGGAPSYNGSGSWSGGSGSPYQSGLYGTDGGMGPPVNGGGGGGGGFYSDTVYYAPAASSAANGYSNTSWNHQWNASTIVNSTVGANGNNNGGRRSAATPAAAASAASAPTTRDSPTPANTAAINFQNNSKKTEKVGNGSGGKGRVRTTVGQNHQNNLAASGSPKADRFHWVRRHGASPEVAKA